MIHIWREIYAMYIDPFFELIDTGAWRLAPQQGAELLFSGKQLSARRRADIWAAKLGVAPALLVLWTTSAGAVDNKCWCGGQQAGDLSTWICRRVLLVLKVCHKRSSPPDPQVSDVQSKPDFFAEQCAAHSANVAEAQFLSDGHICVSLPSTM